MISCHGDGWLTEAGEEFTTRQRHFLRWKLHMKDADGREHVHLCEATEGLGPDMIEPGMLQKWARLLTPGRAMFVRRGTLVRAYKRDAVTGLPVQPPVSWAVILVADAAFPDRSGAKRDTEDAEKQPEGTEEKTPAASSLASAGAEGSSCSGRDNRAGEAASRAVAATTDVGPPRKWPKREKAPSPLGQFLQEETQTQHDYRNQ